jgi:oligopeptide/dipeptide ABC transporter ATP-binding protein
MDACAIVEPAPHIWVESLTVAYEKPQAAGKLIAVSDANLEVARGTFVTIVGPSGCGKSSLLMSIAGLVTPAAGCVHVNGKPVSRPGRDRAMVFQDFALMPWRTVIENVRFGLELQRLRGLTAEDLTARARRYVELVGLKGFEQYHPHQLSGGMRQRVMIAMAVSCNPRLLIADEPTTALDVTIQAQILDLMRELQDRLGTAIILITHDMGVVAENADRVVVMYAGRKVEEASARDLFERPGHPYTKGLLGSIPNVETAAHTSVRHARLNEIKGMVPSLASLPEGCTFAPRCGLATDECRASYPPLQQHGPGHWIACWHAESVLKGDA